MSEPHNKFPEGNGQPHDHDHAHPHEDGHEHDHPHEHPHEDGHDHDHPHEHPHEDGHDHDHPHEHSHEDGHDHGDGSDHDHAHASGLWGWIAGVLHIHSHSHDSMTADPAFNANAEGIRTVWRALAVLGAATVVQVVIVAASGSVALLADTAHNIGDTLNSIPLLAAFYLARRAATRRFTYGYGRAEDVAGILIVLSIGISAAIVLWESLQKLLNPQPMTNLGWVALAAVVGFIGNEAVALLQIRTGRKIGSAAMIADGLHARTDGLTSLAVLGAVGGTLIGLPILDPLIGLLIGVTIVFITRNAVLQVGARLMDAIDPALLHRMEHAIEDVAGVGRIVSLRARWVGHQIFAEMTITVDAARGIGESHAIAEAVRAALAKAVRHLGEVTIQIDPG